jgi:hypothetical protein
VNVLCVDVYLAKWKKIYHSDVKYSLCDDWKTILFKVGLFQLTPRSGIVKFCIVFSVSSLRKIGGKDALLN